MKKKNEVDLQGNDMNVGSLGHTLYYPQSKMNMDEHFIHTHEHIDESNIKSVEAEVSVDTFNQHAQSNHVCVKCLQEKLEEMINEVKEIKHQLTLSKNDLQAYLTTVHNTNTRMAQIEKNLSKVTSHSNEKTKEKRRNYPYVQRKKEERNEK